MNGRRVFVGFLLFGLLLSSSLSPTLAQGPEPAGDVGAQAVLGTGFTYQGRLTDGGAPADGEYDFLFTLFNPEGVQIGDTLVREDVQVTDGLFTVYLDFGDYAFLGWERELEIAVRPGDSEDDYTVLDPRQPITAAPFALSLPGLYTVPNGFSPNVIGGYAGNEMWDVVAGTVSGGGGPEMENRVTDRFGTIGGGANNLAGDESQDPTDAWFATVGGGWQNWATNVNATVVGGAENAASGVSSFVGGGFQNRATEMHASVVGGEDNEASAEGASIGGGDGNRATADGATIAGGTSNTAGGEFHSTVGGGYLNNADATQATIGGGAGNQALEWVATVAGGTENVAAGGASAVSGGFGNMAWADFAAIGGGGRTDDQDPATGNEVTDAFGTIGGGGDNQAGDDDEDRWNAAGATVGGGESNTASGSVSTVGGGYRNTASGINATVGGGWTNEASGLSATVAGGGQNVASYPSATVGGGWSNRALADFATIAGGGRSNSEDPDSGNQVVDAYGAVGGGGENLAGYDDGDPWNATYATVAGGRRNLARHEYASIGGGSYNIADGIASTVGGGEANLAAGDYATVSGGGPIEHGPVIIGNYATDHFATVAGGGGNRAGNGWDDLEDARFATVGGGGENTARSAWATVGGGHGNTAGGNWYATVSGGQANTASNWAATVAGGEENTASASYGTVSGGWGNTAGGNHATVSGGWGNTASGRGATVGGGSDNTAEGDYSFAAGFHAQALHAGSFVWADNSSADDFAGTRPNEFLVRAMAGSWFHADYEEYGLGISNEGTGDGFRATANTSRGDTWGAVYAFNSGTSPGVYANSDGTYAGYFADPIFVNGGCVGCAMVYVAQNAGTEPLEPGELVAPAGVGEALTGTSVPVLRVQRAAAGGGVVGVVQFAAAIAQSEKDGQVTQSANRADGAAQSGDYLFIVVQGMVQVKVDASAGAIAPGTRLTAGETPGHVRALRTLTIEGMQVTEGAPVVGVALGAPDPATGLMPVLVALR